jgi:hypothetical protein
LKTPQPNPSNGDTLATDRFSSLDSGKLQPMTKANPPLNTIGNGKNVIDLVPENDDASDHFSDDAFSL